MVCTLLILIFSITSSHSHLQHHHFPRPPPHRFFHHSSNSSEYLETQIFDDSKKYLFVLDHNTKDNVERRSDRLNRGIIPFNKVNFNLEKKCNKQKIILPKIKNNFIKTQKNENQKNSRGHIEKEGRETSIRNTTNTSIKTAQNKLKKSNHHAQTNDDQKRMKKKRNTDSKMDHLLNDIKNPSKISKIEVRSTSRLVGVNGKNGLQIASLKSLQRHLPTPSSSTPSPHPNNNKFIITTVLDPPFVMLRQDGHYITGNDRFEGFLVDLMKHLATSLSFEFEIRLARDSKYGDLYMGKYWDGAIGEVHRKEADIAIGSLVINNVTNKFVDFTEAFLSLRYSALLKKPMKKKKPKFKSKLQSALNKMKPHDGGSKTFKVERSEGGDDEDFIIKDAKQLVESGITVGVVRDSLAQKLLAQSSLPEHRVLFSRLAQSWPSAFARNRHEGIARARAEKYAFIIDTPIAEYEAGLLPCDVYTTEPFLQLVEYGIIVRKNAVLEIKGEGREVKVVSLKRMFDEKMRKMKEGDTMQSMYLKWWRDECVGQTGWLDAFNTQPTRKNPHFNVDYNKDQHFDQSFNNPPDPIWYADKTVTKNPAKKSNVREFDSNAYFPTYSSTFTSSISSFFYPSIAVIYKFSFHLYFFIIFIYYIF